MFDKRLKQQTVWHEGRTRREIKETEQSSKARPPQAGPVDYTKVQKQLSGERVGGERESLQP